MELAELAPEEAAEFRSGPSALDDVVFRLKEALGLVTFFTVGDTEARSWTLQEGQTALDAAESIHSDIARGFIRCEVIRWDDLLECGSHAEAARRGLQRLEGQDLRRPGRGRPEHPLSTSRQARCARPGSPPARRTRAWH
jgi:ribosome-binding ATPase YchF (GTP1/OBG family)